MTADSDLTRCDRCFVYTSARISLDGEHGPWLCFTCAELSDQPVSRGPRDGEPAVHGDHVEGAPV
jgi:hypothetical protein